MASMSAEPEVLDAGPPNVDPPSSAPEPTAPEPTDSVPPDPEFDAGSLSTDETTDDNEWGLDNMDDPITNPTECPAAEPSQGEMCTAGVVCKYGSEPDCRSRWICDSTGWWLEYAMRDCPEACPEQEPTEGAACDRQSMQCSYGESPSCRGNWMCYDAQWWLIAPGGECDEDSCPAEPPQTGLTCDPNVDSTSGCMYGQGEACSCYCGWEGNIPRVQWYCGTTSAGYPPEYLTACPQEQPEEGSPCDSGSTCAYVTMEECEAPGAGTTLANCEEGKWTLTLPTAAP
jgi:hypothetical protein